MIDRRFDYLLYVYESKPEKSEDVDSNLDFWKFRVVNAPFIPRIGDRIISEGAMKTSYYRVFDIGQKVKGLSELIRENRGTIRQ